ncbi:MAG TPA: hypothetical protein VFE47_06195 [Tepidisphaeraceae bacterium]|jgi:hypothetical protein|nr:hypothetical protein [Tepidisphaeraceae bacterium]
MKTAETESTLCEEGRRLLAQAAPHCDFPRVTLTDSLLQTLTTDVGIDAATALLFHRVSTEPANAAFIESLESAASTKSGDVPRIVVMPGAFHEEYPHTGADGQRILDIAKTLGWPAGRVALPSLAPMAQNAEALVEHLARDPGRPTILVSLSKGGADIRAAFERADAADALKDVRAWVSLSGIITGTPLVQWLRARPLRCTGVRLLLRLRQQRFAVLDELQRGGPLDKPFAAPPGVKVIHLAGFPLQRHLSDAWARRGHRRLSSLGPNDGGGNLLNDVSRWPGVVYPVWEADHYLRPAWDIRPLLSRILVSAWSGV